MTQTNQELRPTITCHQRPLASEFKYALRNEPDPALDKDPDPVLDTVRDQGSSLRPNITCHQRPLGKTQKVSFLWGGGYLVHKKTPLLHYNS